MEVLESVKNFVDADFVTSMCEQMEDITVLKDNQQGILVQASHDGILYRAWLKSGDGTSDVAWHPEYYADWESQGLA